MRAVVLRQPGGPEKLVLEETPDPIPAGDEVLVRVRATAVCGRDLIDRRGGSPMMKLPTVLGHEFAGEVVCAPAGSGFAVGSRVVNLHRTVCGGCRRCLAGETLLCEKAWQSFGHTIDGGYAELVAAPSRALVKLPDAIPFDVGATLMCTAGVGLRALRTRARLEIGETVLITGASGGVGAAAVQIAHKAGARVIAVTSSPSKVDALRELGADDVLVSRDGRFHDDAHKLCDGGVDLALELTGSATFGSSLKSVRRGGRMVIVGNIDATRVQINPGAMILNGHTIIAAASCTSKDLLDVFRLVETGVLTPRIDRRLPLGEAAEAHRLLGERSVVGRVVLMPDLPATSASAG